MNNQSPKSTKVQSSQVATFMSVSRLIRHVRHMSLNVVSKIKGLSENLLISCLVDVSASGADESAEVINRRISGYKTLYVCVLDVWL